MKAAILPSGDVAIHLSSDEAAPIILTLTRWVLAQETAVGLSVFSREFWRQLKRRDIERKRALRPRADADRCHCQSDG